MKQCKKCGLTKTLTEFSKRSNSSDGLQPKCKECNKVDNAKFRQIKPLYKKEWDINNPGAQCRIVKEAYKRNPQRHKDTIQKYFRSWGAGIYLLTNTITKEKYVGSTQLLRERYNAMTRGIKEYNQTNVQKSLAQHIKHYGKENFTFEILEKVEDLSLLRKKAAYWIKKLQPEYNIQNKQNDKNKYNRK